MIQKNFEELRLTGQLPSPSGVGMQILKLTQGDDFSTEEIGQAISADSALTGRLLKLANSAESGSVQPITTIGEATIRLGIRTVRNVALGLSLVSSNREGACTAFDYDRYWSLSLARAVAGQQLSRQLKVGIPAEMYILGLLADIGSLALASVHPEAYAELLTHSEHEGPEELLKEEESRFEINHSEIAACMLGEWGLPDGFGMAAAKFEFIDFADEQSSIEDTASLLQAANIIASICLAEDSIGKDAWREKQKAYEAVRGSCSMEPERFDQLCNSISAEWREWGQVLSIPTQYPVDFAAIEKKVAQVGKKAAVEPALKPQVSPAAPATPGAAVSPSGLRVLAVDDDPVSLKMLQRHLMKAGHEVVIARDGEEALKLALDQNPQLVVADWMMPGLDGVALCKALRQITDGRKIYFLLLTGKDNEDEVLQAFDAGVDDYVTKPFNPRILLARIQAGSRIISLQAQVEKEQERQRKNLRDLAVLTRKLRSAALTDTLTGLPNRRYAMKRLGQAWEASARTGNPMSTIMMDIDFFKKVNDEHGHDAGDAVLRETATKLQEVCREEEDVCRIGGEEFLVICANADAEEARKCAERIRAAVEAQVIHWKEFNRAVTMSLGVAAREPEMASGEDLMKASDEAVYIAKANGRNQVVVSELNLQQKKSA